MTLHQSFTTASLPGGGGCPRNGRRRGGSEEACILEKVGRYPSPRHHQTKINDLGVLLRFTNPSLRLQAEDQETLPYLHPGRNRLPEDR